MYIRAPNQVLPAILTALLVLVSSTAWSHGVSYGRLTIDHPYAVLSQDRTAASVFFRDLVNRGQETFVITGAQTAVAEYATLQTETHSSDHVQQWIDVESIAIGPKASVLFRHNHESGYRIYLTGLKRELKNRDRFDLTLTFGDGGQKTVDVWVQTPRVRARPHTH